MSILSEGYLTTKDLMQYIKDEYSRHWSKTYISILIKEEVLPCKEFGRQNIFIKKDVDNFIKTLSRPSSSGIRGVKYVYNKD